MIFGEKENHWSFFLILIVESLVLGETLVALSSLHSQYRKSSLKLTEYLKQRKNSSLCMHSGKLGNPLSYKNRTLAEKIITTLRLESVLLDITGKQMCQLTLIQFEISIFNSYAIFYVPCYWLRCHLFISCWILSLIRKFPFSSICPPFLWRQTCVLFAFLP